MPEEVKTERLTPSEVDPSQAELQALRSENAQLLRELENAYAQLTAVMQVSQDETRIAYSELQEKLVVLEKKLLEVDLLSEVGEALASETRLEHLRHSIVEKVCLSLPVDLAALHLQYNLQEGTHRERDMVFETWVQGDLLEKIRRSAELIRAHPKPLIVSDLNQAPEFAALRLRSDARSAAAVPLRTNKFLGVLILNSRLPSNFRLDQEPLLDTYGSQASAALKQALRLRRLENLIVHVFRDQQLPMELLGEAEQLQENDGQFDRLVETVRSLFAEQ